jgi:Mg-chelatase subunit ChlD
MRNFALGGVTLALFAAPAACGGGHGGAGMKPTDPTRLPTTSTGSVTAIAPPESTVESDVGAKESDDRSAPVIVDAPAVRKEMPAPREASDAMKSESSTGLGGYAGATAAPTTISGSIAASDAKVSAGPMRPTAPPPSATPMWAPTAPKGKRAGDSAGDGVGAFAGAPPASTTVTTTVTTTVHSGGPIVAPPVRESPQGGLLTAAIWDDNERRAGFLTFVDRYPAFRAQWGLDLSRRVTIRVTDSAGVLVGDAPIALRAPDGTVVDLRTHGDGTALYYPPASAVTCCAQSPFSVAAQSGALRAEGSFSATSSDSTWTLKLPGVPTRSSSPALDLAFVVDTTGSMGDEIAYLQAELAGVVKRVKTEHAMRRVRLGLVLYKDRGDEYVTRTFDFTEDLSKFLGELAGASASGGGDMPESVNQALRDTVKELSWAGDESARMAVLVADAPPHYYADEQYTYKNAINDLSARGVKLVTLGASGIDKTTEYVFRQMSAYTGGRYIFLTDDSGVGESHLTPDISGYQVEHLDRLLVRTIGDEVRAFAR